MPWFPCVLQPYFFLRLILQFHKRLKNSDPATKKKIQKLFKTHINFLNFQRFCAVLPSHLLVTMCDPFFWVNLPLQFVFQRPKGKGLRLLGCRTGSERRRSEIAFNRTLYRHFKICVHTLCVYLLHAEYEMCENNLCVFIVQYSKYEMCALYVFILCKIWNVWTQSVCIYCIQNMKCVLCIYLFYAKYEMCEHNLCVFIVFKIWNVYSVCIYCMQNMKYVCTFCVYLLYAKYEICVHILCVFIVCKIWNMCAHSVCIYCIQNMKCVLCVYLLYAKYEICVHILCVFIVYKIWNVYSVCIYCMQNMKYVYTLCIYCMQNMKCVYILCILINCIQNIQCKEKTTPWKHNNPRSDYDIF